MEKELSTMSTMSTATSTTASDRGDRRTRLAVGTTLVLLIAEFLLGMYVNLFVPAPTNQPVLRAHILVGTLLVVLAVVTAVIAIAGRRRAVAVLAVAGLLFLLIAWIGGARFLGFGGHNADSYLMASGFLFAAVSYGMAFDLARTKTP
jgi:hypothetical protein